MNQILALREKRAKAWDAAKAFLDTHRGTDGMLSAEDGQTYDRMEADVVNLGKEIERLERQQAMDAELNRPTSSPVLNNPVNPIDRSRNPRGTDEYCKSFWNVMRSKGAPAESYNVLRIGEDADGGYLAPDEYQRTLIQALEEENIIRKLAHRIGTTSGDRKIPVSASKGTAAWMDENAAYPEDDDKFGQISIGAHKVGTIIKVSEELLNDSAFDVADYIAKEFGRRIGAAEEEAFLTGDGKGKPTGILNATGGAQTGVTAAAADKITADELMDLFYSLRAPYRRKAVWVLNDSTVKLIRKMKNNNGDYIWQPSLTAGQPDTILNRPIHTSAYMPVVGTGVKPIAFGNLDYYWIADRQGRSFKRLNELYAANGQVGFLSSERVDGKLVLPEAVKTLVMA